jgi:signal transduction histidine kinase
MSDSRRAPEDLKCRVPEDEARQAVLNLVLNSVAVLGDASGTVIIDAEYRNGALAIQVVDDGPGFPEALLSGGVRPFVTSRSRDWTRACDRGRFARDLGGELSSRIVPGGACVTLTLPCAREDVRPLLLIEDERC